MVAIKVEKIDQKEPGFLYRESEILLTLSRAVAGEPILRHYSYGQTYPSYRFLVSFFILILILNHM